MTDQIIINNAQREKAKAFLRMHQTEGMFVIPNAWDAASAYIYEKAGFAAVATTSAGIAYALGYPDGEQVSLEDLLFVVKKITGRVQVPVSVDFERGYAEEPAQVKENARRLLAAGAVGFNLEDGQADGRLSPLELQVQKIQALCELKKELALPFVINARTCAYWLNIGSEGEKLAEAVRRGNAFAEAGADCVFVPGAMNQETARALVSGIHAPLNLILNGVYHDFMGLAKLGVRRFSTGSGPVRYLCEETMKMAEKIKDGDVDAVLQSTFSYAKANAFFQK